MSAPRQLDPDPLASVPPPAEVINHIGRLLRELQLARRLLRLARAAELQRQTSDRKAVADGR